MPLSVNRALLKAKSHAKRGEADLAAQLYQSVLDKFPDNKRAIAGLAALRQPGAGGTAPRAGPSQEQINELMALYNQGNLQQALARGETLAKQFPHAPFIQNVLGAVNVALGRLENAVASYHKALAIKPDFAEVHNYLGVALEALGRIDEAVAPYRQALSIKPDFAEAHYNLANALHALGKLDQARRHFDLADTGTARARSLGCSYAIEKYDDFHNKLDALVDHDGSNLRAAAISAFAAHQLGHDDPYPFCRNPLDFVRIRHIDDCAADTEGLIDGLLHDLGQRSAAWQPTNVTTKFGFQTPADLFSSPENSLAGLDQLIKQEIAAYHAEYGSRPESGSRQCIFTDIWAKEHRLVGWSVRLLDQGHQASHIHPSGWLSGVIYLQIPPASQEDEGAIEFSLHGYDYPILNDEYPRLLHHPKVGELILFPSSLFHKTVPISGDSERLSIAFDLLPLRG